MLTHLANRNGRNADLHRYEPTGPEEDMSNMDGGAICYILEVLSPALYGFWERVVFRVFQFGNVLGGNKVRKRSPDYFLPSLPPARSTCLLAGYTSSRPYRMQRVKYHAFPGIPQPDFQRIYEIELVRARLPRPLVRANWCRTRCVCKRREWV